MKIKSYLVISLALIAVIIFPSSAFAASFSTSAESTTVKEKITNTLEDENGKDKSVGDAIIITVKGDEAVSDANSSSLNFDVSASGGCGMPQGKGPIDILYYSITSTISLLPDEPKKQFFVVPIYNSDYTGTRTCTITFTHDAASSQNSEVSSKYGSANMSPITINITDAQTQPSQTDQEDQKDEDKEEKPEDENKDPVEIDTITAGGESYDADDEDIEFEHGEPIAISGNTVPNGLVKLYIYSELQEAEVTADSDGNWLYTIEEIESGDHRIEAEVTDPKTNETSERMQIIAFSVEEAQEELDAAPVEEVDESSGSIMPFIFIAIILVAAVAGGIWWYLKKKKSKNNIPDPITPAPEFQPSEIETPQEDDQTNDPTSQNTI